MRCSLLLSLLSLLCGLLSPTLLLAQDRQAARTDARGAALLTPEQVVNPDGTIRLDGPSGSVDLAGWQMVFGADGTPRLVQGGQAIASDDPDDVYWDDQFYPSGVGGDVYSMALDGSPEGGGTLYVGGYFTTAGRIPANFIAAWDGSTWRPLGSGMNGSVRALALDGSPGNGGTLFVGGEFTTAGGKKANRIAAWDGATWHNLGYGVDGGGTYRGIYALVLDGSPMSGGMLYAAGRFTTAGGTTANSIAAWDGTAWHALGDGMNYSNASGSHVGSVYTLALDGSPESGGTLYAGGGFTQAGGVQAGSIAAWDGTAWHALGDGLQAPKGYLAHVYAIALDGSPGHGGTLYAGGDFTNAGGTTASDIAAWDGIDWQTLGDGMNASAPIVAVYTLALDGSPGDGGTLYAGGRFTTAGDTAANSIAAWDGIRWHALGSGIVGGRFVHALALDGSPGDGGTLYAGGTFGTAGDTAASNIAAWDGEVSQWLPLASGNGIDYEVKILALDGSPESGGTLYAGGEFTAAGGTPASAIAAWDGTAWHPLGDGMNCCVYALALDGSPGHGGTLYAGGEFTAAGEVQAHYIAAWDGSSWHTLGSGTNGPVYALALDGSPESGGTLYAGGYFLPAARGTPVNGIVAWDGTAWHPLGAGVDNYVRALALDGSPESGGTLYVGGEFTTAGGKQANRIAAWDGADWQSLGSGVSSPVYALALDGSPGNAGTLYAGGSFAAAGDTPASGIAAWDGAAWHALGDGVGGTVYALALDGSPGNAGTLYAGGYLRTEGSKPATSIMAWDGSAWHTLGSGLETPVDGLAIALSLALDPAAADLYVGGRFATAGAKPSSGIARWTDTSVLPVRTEETPGVAEAFQLTAPYPNPLRDQAQVALTVARRQHIEVALYDVLGRRVALLFEGEVEANTERTLRINRQGLANGMYLIRAEGEYFIATRPLTVVR